MKLIAVRIRSIEIQPDIEIFGAIEALGDTSWTLSGIDLIVNADTLIQGEPASRPAGPCYGNAPACCIGIGCANAAGAAAEGCHQPARRSE